MTTPESIAVNGRDYAWPERPLVAVCVDGCEPDYLDRAIRGGHMPFMARARAEGTDLLARSVVPSPGGSTFSATRRASFECTASYTTPIEPYPTSRWIL